MSNQVYISQDANEVNLVNTDKQLVITEVGNGTSVNVTQPITSVIEVATIGPQGQAGPAGPQGPSGSLQPNSSGSFGITGSLTLSGSNPLTVMGPVVFTGSLNVTQGITGSLLGTSSYALTASYAANVPTTASYALSASVAVSSSYAVSASYLIGQSPTSSYALTASYLNPLNQDVSLTGNIVIRGTASVDVLVTNYESSSIIYSSGSTKFGDTLDDTHQFTGSVYITGSAVELQGGSFSGSGANLFNIPASGITGLNLSQIATGSVTASVSSGTGSFTISSGSSNFLFVSSSGNVGIGTTTPSRLLHVNEGGTRLYQTFKPGVPTLYVYHGRTENDSTVRFENGSGDNLYFGGNGLFVTGNTNIGSGTTLLGARLGVRGSGATSSTTALLVQNSNASASLSVTDDRLVTVSSKLQVGTFTPGVATGSSTIFTTGRISAGGGITLYNPTNGDDNATGIFFNNGLQIYSQNAAVALFRPVGGGDSGFMFNVGGYTYNPPSGTGTVNTVLVNNSLIPQGANSINYNYVTVAPSITQGSFGTGTIRGFYFAPSVSSLNTSPLRAFESTRGDIIVGGNAVVAITGSLSITGSAGTGSALYAYKSGSAVVDIQGSQGQLFSVIDALSGSLMSVNDISGLPILEVFSDDRVVMGTYGNAGLIVTGSDVQISASLFGTRQTGSLATGSTLLYTVNTGSYTAGFFDYFINSGSNYRAGNIMAVFGAGTYKFTDLATPDIGSTTNLQFSMSIAGASAQLYASASSAGWTVKTTFRTI